MTDETEAVARAIHEALLLSLDLNRLAQAAITALDKHRIERAGDVEKELNGRSCSLALNDKAATTIASLRAEIERGRQVIAEIAEFCANTGKGNPIVDERIIDRVEEVAVEYLHALDAEAIAKGEA